MSVNAIHNKGKTVNMNKLQISDDSSIRIRKYIHFYVYEEIVQVQPVLEI